MNSIVYLHGFASGPASNKARHFRQALEATGFVVEVPDLAQGDFEHLTVTGQLTFLEALIDQRPVSLIGSSLGGYLAALYAARHPEVSRLVLLAPAFGFGHRWPLRLGPETVAEWRRTGSLEVFHYAEKRSRAVAYGLLEDAALYPDFPDFRQPALIFHGAHDDVVPPELSRDFTATHPNATLEIVDSGHELLNVLAEITPRTLDFLGLSV
jgi:pimeloyl-ACP methyl ester carboxylesterase